MEIAAALEEHHREPDQKVRKRTVGGKRREHEKAVGRNAVADVDLGAPEVAAGLDGVGAPHQRQSPVNLVVVLRAVARTRDRVSNAGIPVHDEVRRPEGRLERVVVLKTQRPRRGVVEALVEQELIAGERDPRIE